MKLSSSVACSAEQAEPSYYDVTAIAVDDADDDVLGVAIARCAAPSTFARVQSIVVESEHRSGHAGPSSSAQLQAIADSAEDRVAIASDASSQLLVALEHRGQGIGSAAKLQSILVAPEYRGRGVGTALVGELERALVARGVATIECVYDPSLNDVTKILQRRGFVFTPPAMICDGSAKILDAPWMSLALPAGDELFPWSALTEGERNSLRMLDLPAELDPFGYEPFEPINSFGLRRNDEVIAWLITRRVEPELIAYASLFVRPDRRAHARGVAMVAEAIRRQVDADVPRATFSVRADNAPMRRFVERRAAPYLDAITYAVLAQKRVTAPNL